MGNEKLREAFVAFRQRAATILCETRGHSGPRPCDFCLNVTLFDAALAAEPPQQATQRFKAIRLEDGGAMGTHVVIEAQLATEQPSLSSRSRNDLLWDRVSGSDEQIEHPSAETFDARVQCMKCGHIFVGDARPCPKCGSKNIHYKVYAAGKQEGQHGRT